MVDIDPEVHVHPDLYQGHLRRQNTRACVLAFAEWLQLIQVQYGTEYVAWGGEVDLSRHSL